MQFPKARRRLNAALTTEYLGLLRKGDDGGGDTPLPIPNREVKPASADGTARETSWESRSSPIFLSFRPVSRSAFQLILWAYRHHCEMSGFLVGVFAIIFGERDEALFCLREELAIWNSPGGGQGQMPWRWFSAVFDARSPQRHRRVASRPALAVCRRRGEDRGPCACWRGALRRTPRRRRLRRSESCRT